MAEYVYASTWARVQVSTSSNWTPLNLPEASAGLQLFSSCRLRGNFCQRTRRKRQHLSTDQKVQKMVGDDELLEELEQLGQDNPGEDGLEKMREMCTLYGMDATKLVEQWMAYTFSGHNISLSMDTLPLFEQWLQKRKNKDLKTPTTKKNKPKMMYDSNSIQSMMDCDAAEDLLEAYSTPGAKDGETSKKRQITPDMAPNKRRTALTRSPIIPFSPSSFSPAGKTCTPSQKYSARAKPGEVVCTFGNPGKVEWQRTNAHQVQVSPWQPEMALTTQFKYMFQKLSDQAHVLNDMIDDMASFLKEQHKIEEDYAHVALPVQVPVTVVGRICCDSNGKLNAKSVLLEGSRDTSSGKRIPLDLSQVAQYSIFPGQIVAVEGLNSTGNVFVAKKIYESLPPPLPEKKPAEGPCSVLVAAGPFTTSDSLLYEPLGDLVNCLQKETPDVCILLGPFVDEKFPDLENVANKEGKTFQTLFDEITKPLINSLRGLDIQLVLVPSWRDLHHHYVYPQPPYVLNGLSKEDKKWVHAVSDPCLLDINGTVFGITSTDVLFHLGAEEVSCPPGGSDRLARLTRHILAQHHFYPLYPPSEDINIDYDQFEQYAKMPVTPNVLVLPSDLRYFLKDVGGCVCVNPGRLTKGQVGGTYTRLLIRPNSGPVSSSSITGHVMRI